MDQRNRGGTAGSWSAGARAAPSGSLIGRVYRAQVIADNHQAACGLPFDGPCAALCGDIGHDRETAGTPTAVEDAMIAAAFRAHGVRAVATRNIRDLGCGVLLINPWQPP